MVNHSIEIAFSWIDSLIFGSVATTLAVIAIASTGLLLLSGRIDWRRGARVVLGCFILFGASSLAASLLNAARSSATTDPPAPAIEPFTPPPPAPPQATQPKTVCWTCGTTTPPAPPKLGAELDPSRKDLASFPAG